MTKLEIYGSATCPYTQELRESLEWTRRDFVEYDIEANPEARRRLRSLDASLSTMPLLVEDGKIIQIGWQGRGCVMGLGS